MDLNKIIKHMNLNHLSNDTIFGCLLFGISALIGNYGSICHKPVLIVSKADNSNSCYTRLQRILANVPSLYKIFYPPFFFSNGYLQLIPFTLECWWMIRFPLCNFITEFITLPDGEKIVLDWVNEIPTIESVDFGRSVGCARPIVIIHHGANCHSRDLPGQIYIREAMKRGWHVCILNRRGHNKALTRPNFNFLGSTDDLRHVISTHLETNYPSSKLFMVGMSAGSGLIASYMGQQGHATTYAEPEQQQTPGYITAAVGVSPGYNIEQCMSASRLVPPFNKILMNSTNKNFMIPNKHLFESDPKYNYEALVNAPDMQTWLDNSYACAGYGSKQAYYDATNPMRFVEYISQPCLFINAVDDPLCHIHNLHDDQHVFDRGAHGCSVAVTETGSHCSFLELGLATNWTERVTFEFFDAVLAELDSGTPNIQCDQIPK